MPIHFRRTRIPKNHKAQSFVEFAVFLPIFLIMVTGLTEFGFLLNQFLNIMDGPREAARSACNDPALIKPELTEKRSPFYANAITKALKSTQPFPLCTTHSDCPTKLALDDVVVSVFTVDGGSVAHRYPETDSLGFLPTEGYYGHYATRFTTNAQVNSLINSGPNTGMVLVEIFYNYDQLLKLPWITVFVPDPILLYSYTMMPCPVAEP